jgi:hypothetical protein
MCRSVQLQIFACKQAHAPGMSEGEVPLLLLPSMIQENSTAPPWSLPRESYMEGPAPLSASMKPANWTRPTCVATAALAPFL